MFIAVNIAVSLFFAVMIFFGIYFRIRSFIPINMIGFMISFFAILADIFDNADKLLIFVLMLIILSCLVTDFFITFSRKSEKKIADRLNTAKTQYLKIENINDYFKLIASPKILATELSRQPHLSRSRKKNAINHWLAGNLAFNKQNFQEALKNYQLSIAIAPSSVTFLNQSGVYLYLDRNTEAIVSCEQALQLNPASSAARLNLSIVLERLNRDQEALKIIKQAQNYKPVLAELFLVSAKIYLKSANRNAALEAFEKALNINNSLPPGWFQKGVCYTQMGKLSEAIASFSKAIELSPNYYQAYYCLGNSYNQIKKYEQAISHYQKATAIKPAYKEAWNNSGIALCKLGRHLQGLQCYEKALVIRNDYHEAWLNQALAFEALEYYNDAIASYQKFLKYVPFSMKDRARDTQRRIRILHSKLNPENLVLLNNHVTSNLKRSI